MPKELAEVKEFTGPINVPQVGDAPEQYPVTVEAMVQALANRTSYLQATLPQVISTTALRALTAGKHNHLLLAGYAAAGDGGGGMFYWDAASIEADNGGTVLRPDSVAAPNPGRWMRVFDGPLDVRWFGAVGDGVADDTAALQATVDAAVSAKIGRVYLPQGAFRTTATIDLGSNRLALVGAGSPGQDAGVALGNSRILVDHAGWGLIWAVGAGSSQFQGVTLQDFHMQQAVGAAAVGGIHLGNASNCHLDRVTVSDFETGTGIKVGEAGTSGSQYNEFSGFTISNCLVGLDLVDSNGFRALGGFLEIDPVAPPAGSIGVRIQDGSDTVCFVGTVIQGFETLISQTADSGQFLGVRFEGFGTAMVILGTAKRNVVLGGSINNFISGGAGTGFVIEAGASDNLIWGTNLESVGTSITDAGTNTSRYLKGTDVQLSEAIESAVIKTLLSIDREGVGAQNPELIMSSNALAGPTLKTDSAFARLVLNHAWSGATELALQLRGTDILRGGYDGSTRKLGFFGTAPGAKPTVSGSKGGNAALASLITALANLGLIADTSS